MKLYTALKLNPGLFKYSLVLHQLIEMPGLTLIKQGVPFLGLCSLGMQPVGVWG